MKRKSIFFPAIFLGLLVSTYSIAQAAMESSSYRIDADIITGAGGEGESSSYLLQQTLLDLSHSEMEGSSYNQVLGFLSQVNTTMTLTLSTNSINFGSIGHAGSATDSFTISVKTDAWNGYTASIEEDQSLTHTDTATTIPDYPGTIETPTTWSGTGLGFTINSGTCIHSKWNSGSDYAGIPESTTEFHNTKRGDARDCPGYQAPASGADDTVIGLKVVPENWQKAGDYSNNVTITVAASI